MNASGGSRNGLQIYSEDVIITIAVPAGFSGYTKDVLEHYHLVGETYIMRHVEDFPHPLEAENDEE